ncbi:MAG: hypothetical protein H6978_10310 [Gammaproteobacteria bacterium]|nr:hypothetical protein [Gammaproteobacteria bacterium]
MTSNAGNTLADRIDKIEGAYEFMLAYAAQGRDQDEGPGAMSGIRFHLDALATGLSGLAEDCRVVAAHESATFDPFIDLLATDSHKALVAVRLVAAQKSISSQLIDNLNASIHLRALLTDLFLMDEALKYA